VIQASRILALQAESPEFKPKTQQKKNKKKLGVVGGQEIEWLFRLHKAPSSNPSTGNKRIN
jgi:hypothetical protein